MFSRLHSNGLEKTDSTLYNPLYNVSGCDKCYDKKEIRIKRIKKFGEWKGKICHQGILLCKCHIPAEMYSMLEIYTNSQNGE